MKQAFPVLLVVFLLVAATTLYVARTSPTAPGVRAMDQPRAKAKSGKRKAKRKGKTKALGVRANDDRPNVLFIVWDTVRADRMSLYGHDRPTTPRLSAFAKDALVFDRATSSGMWTLPAHASMFTGLPARSHGATASVRWLDDQHQTLAELLKDSGYNTFAFTSNLIASPMTNLLQGFDTVHTTFPRKGVPKGQYVNASKNATKKKRIATDASNELSPMFQGDVSEKWGKSVHKDAGDVAHEALIAHIEGTGGPWFAYINMMEAHSPRLPSLANRKKLLDDETLNLGLQTDASLASANAYIAGQKEYTADELEAIRGVYDAAIRDLDDVTGDLLDDLARRGVLDDTLVILVSDHGEMLGEHRMMEHRWAVWEPLFHVPLVVRFPKQGEGTQAKHSTGRRSERVSTADLFATVLEFAELEDKSSATRSRSLVDAGPRGVVKAELTDPYEEMMAGLKRSFPGLDLTSYKRTYRVAWQEDIKWTSGSDGHVHLVDLAKDPSETKNLMPGGKAIADKLQQNFESWYDGLTPFQAGAQRGAPEEDICGLCALGYKDGPACDAC